MDRRFVPMVSREVRDAALHDSVVMQFIRTPSPWNLGLPKPRPWYRRLWHRIDHYLPRVSVHLGPR